MSFLLNLYFHGNWSQQLTFTFFKSVSPSSRLQYICLPWFEITNGYWNFQLIQLFQLFLMWKWKPNRFSFTADVSMCYKQSHKFLWWYFFRKAKCHHALLDRECKSINTFFFPHPFSVKKVTHSAFIRSGHFFSSWKLSPSNTISHLLRLLCWSRNVCSLLWTGNWFKESVLLI